MSVQFLSTEWAEALKAHLNGNDAFTQAAQGQNATIQQVITGGEGESLYWIRIADAAIDMGAKRPYPPRKNSNGSPSPTTPRSRTRPSTIS